MVLMYARRCWMTLTPIRSPGTVVVLATLCACGHSSATANSGGATDAGAAGGEAGGATDAGTASGEAGSGGSVTTIGGTGQLGSALIPSAPTLRSASSARSSDDGGAVNAIFTFLLASCGLCGVEPWSCTSQPTTLRLQISSMHGPMAT